MTTTLTIRKAEAADLETVEGLRAEAINWLASKGLDQWQPGQPRVPTRASTADAVRRGTCLLAEDEGRQVIATITIDDRADPEFWTAEEQAEPALYIHRMIVSRQAEGKHVGSRLLDWAAEFAATTRREWLRLDAWKTNAALHRYYQRAGFTHVRTVDLAHRGSGALFQRPTRRPSALGQSQPASDTRCGPIVDD